MTPHIREYRIPTQLAEALQLVDRLGDRAAVSSGGSMQALSLPTRVTTLIDLTRCGLEGLRFSKSSVRLGATVSAATLAADPELDELGSGMLRETAGAVTPMAVRNQVRLAGNLVGYMSWADLPVTLLALDAEVVLERKGAKPRNVSLAELFEKHPRKVLKQGEIITAVDVPRNAKAAGAFVKMSRTVADVALASTAVWLDLKGDTVRAARIAVGAVRPRPGRQLAAEKLLTGKKLDAALISEAAAKAVSGINIASDARASKRYRQRLLRVAIERALNTAWDRARDRSTYEPPRRVEPEPWTRKPPATETGDALVVTVDGNPHLFAIRPSDSLLEVLRREGMTSVKKGCDDGYCGACSVMADGRLLNACMVNAAHVDGCELTTVAGIGTIFEPHELQEAFVEEGAVQCGFCTPGMIVAAKALLDQIPDPTDSEIREALDGNLCRCTGYVKPLAAVHNAVERLKGAR